MIAELGDTLVTLLERAHRRIPSRAREAVEWLADATRPPPGLSLHADDGSVYTGLVFVKDSRPVAMLAVRTGSERTNAPPPRPQPRVLFGPEPPLWDSDPGLR